MVIGDDHHTVCDPSIGNESPHALILVIVPVDSFAHVVTSCVLPTLIPRHCSAIDPVVSDKTVGSPNVIPSIADDQNDRTRPLRQPAIELVLGLVEDLFEATSPPETVCNFIGTASQQALLVPLDEGGELLRK